MTVDNMTSPTARLQPAKMIVCKVPDDGTDIELMRRLRKEKGVTRAESIACRGVFNLQQAKTRLGKLPEPILYRVVTIIVSVDKADDVFEFVRQQARIGEAGRGAMIESSIIGATAYSMPDDIPEENAAS